MPHRAWLQLFVSFFLSPFARANDLSLALPVPYRIVQDALIAQVFIGPAQTARVLEGPNGCNTLTLSEARVEGGARRRVRILTTLTAHVGTPLSGGQCLALFDWSGVLETNEEPYLASSHFSIGFRVVDSNILQRDGKRASAPGVVWDWVKKYVHPRLEGFALDLSPTLNGARDFVLASASDTATVTVVFDSSRVKSVVAAAETLNVELEFSAPPIPAGWQARAPEPALTEEALERWREVWQRWEGFATWVIKQVAADVDDPLRAAFSQVLLEGRYDLVAILATDGADDPVPALFIKTWVRLAGPLRQASTRVSGTDAIRLLAFISAAEAWQVLRSAAPQLGLTTDANMLRRLARALLPAVDDSALVYSTAVDPALRTLLGFDSEFPVAAGAQEPWWLRLVQTAEAATSVDPALSQRLNGWVPESADLDTYLAAVSTLFEQLATAELGRGKVQPPFAAVYQTLLRATAWQETCWRQYVLKDRRVQTIRSVSGSVGIMQVNTHVWRGIYDLQGLTNDVGYNARAGNEILVRYFVDYAIKLGEHKAAGGIDNLARASYAVYNGGPGHLKRYRIRGTNETLRQIDAAFWKKYQTLKRAGVDSAKAVRECYGT